MQTQDSDWDFVVIVADEFPMDPAYLEEFRTTQGIWSWTVFSDANLTEGERKRGQYKLGDVNATVFPASLWQELIEQHLVLCLSAH